MSQIRVRHTDKPQLTYSIQIGKRPAKIYLFYQEPFFFFSDLNHFSLSLSFSFLKVKYHV